MAGVGIVVVGEADSDVVLEIFVREPDLAQACGLVPGDLGSHDICRDRDGIGSSAVEDAKIEPAALTGCQSGGVVRNEARS